MLTWPIIRQGLMYILSGQLRVKKGHLPQLNHPIPDDFVGVCVASSADAGMDDYVVSQLRALGIEQVRLDFTYGDLENFNARFLSRLIVEKFQITLHIIQPFSNAKNMQSLAEQATWKTFVSQVLERYGTDLKRIEIGSTINRKRWAGYTVEGFFAAWQIAFNTAKASGVALAGPNVTDFEPIYNIGILKMLKAKNQLPDIHTNNLFSERVSEPERFDHRIFKYRWATCFKYNLVKKARLLKKIGTDFGIEHFISPVAFWAIYRIERLLPDGEQKQADYAARYMLLNAASGALDQAFWGALICHREGLIDDGLNDATYPVLERVTHYASVDGELKNFWRHASFNAMKTVAKLVQGAHYQGALATANGLEVHHFQTATHEVQACWTINGKVALLADIYTQQDLAQAEISHRDGEILAEKPAIITESPIYLRWLKGVQISVNAQPSLAKNLAIHAHIQGLQYYPFQQDGWFGMILAKNASEAQVIASALHPEKLSAPQKNAALRHARNAIWALPDPRDGDKQVTVKQPVKMYPHKAFLDRLKPSKAKRSWNGAVELLRRGIATAQPVAFFEKIGDSTLKQNFYICGYVQADANVGEMFVHFANGNQLFEFKQKNISVSAEETYLQLAQYLHKMHKNGAYFRDLSGGNVLVQVSDDKQLHFSLIDTARAWFYTHPTPFKYRIADLTRMCNKLHWAGRERFLGLYLANTGKKCTSAMRRAFYLYDFKVDFKRKFGRKGIKKLLKKFN
ncbi:MAG TPA: lipopolysaccharide kinase InaA family protein [Methylotenera sp.]|nr:lipopolysaccharide kinase InaA family protein [Methylotenera sp.]